LGFECVGRDEFERFAVRVDGELAGLRGVLFVEGGGGLVGEVAGLRAEWVAARRLLGWLVGGSLLGLLVGVLSLLRLLGVDVAVLGRGAAVGLVGVAGFWLRLFGGGGGGGS